MILPTHNEDILSKNDAGYFTVSILRLGSADTISAWLIGSPASRRSKYVSRRGPLKDKCRRSKKKLAKHRQR